MEILEEDQRVRTDVTEEWEGFIYVETGKKS